MDEIVPSDVDLDILSNGIKEAFAKIANLSAEEHIALLERNADLLPRLQAIALRVAGPGAFVDHGGVAYLQGNAAAHIAAFLGISIVPGTPRWAPEPRLWEWPVAGIWPRFGAITVQIGTRSTEDAFMASNPEHAEANARKAALQNGISRVVSRLLGFAHLTSADLLRMGASASSVIKIERKKGGDEATAEKLAAMVADLKADMIAAFGPEKAEEKIKAYTRYKGRDGNIQSQTFETIRYTWQVKKAREQFEKEMNG